MNMRKIISLLLAIVMVCGIIPFAVFAEGETTTVTTEIKTYAADNGWTNEKQYKTVEMDSVITVTAEKTASNNNNTGKYYTNGYEWRVYQTETPKITVSAAEGATIVSVKFTYNVNKGGVLTNGSTKVSSNTVISVDAPSIVLGVGNTGSASNGQVKITKIEVTYTTGSTTGGEDPAPETPATPTLAEDLAAAAALSNGQYLDHITTITGVISKIEDYNEYYKSYYMYVDVDGTEVYCYSLPEVNNAELGVGDTVTVSGHLTAYNGTPQYSYKDSATTLTLVKKLPTLAEDLAAAAALSNGQYLDHITTITGKISKIEDYNEYYKSYYMYVDVDGTEVYCYSLSEINNAELGEGDTVTVSGHLTAYNGTPQYSYKDSATTLTLVEKAQTPENPETPENPDTPEFPAIVDTPEADTAYKFGMVQGKLNKVYYLAGGMDNFYMATTEDVNAAIDVYLEETEGGYYLYTIENNAKVYINIVKAMGTDGKEHINGVYEAAASTVYTYDAEKKTVITDIDGEAYWHGTRNDKTYTTVGPCAVSYNGFYCQFYPVADETPENPENPENPEDPEVPEEPKVPETLAEQIAEAEKLNNGEHLPYESTITGTIIDEPKASDYNEGQYKFTVSDGTNTIMCYYTPVADGVVPAKGDTATVVGKLTAYEGAAQFDETAIAVVVNNVPEQPENPEQPGTGDEAPETSGVSIVAMAVLSVLSGSALVLLKKKEF